MLNIIINSQKVMVLIKDKFSFLKPNIKRKPDENIPNKFIKANISFAIAPAIYELGILLNKIVVTMSIDHNPPTHSEEIIIDSLCKYGFIF